MSTKIPTIEQQYQSWLKTMGLSEATMPETQKIQLRQAFFGGVTALINEQLFNLADLPEEAGAQQMDDWLEECKKYWKDEVERHKQRTRRN